MSTIKATNFQHPSAASPAIVLDAAGGATVAGMGLVLVKPTSIANSGGSALLSGGAVTFTGVTSVSLNGVFTTEHVNYSVVLTITLASGADAYLRWRVAGVNATGNDYVSQFSRALGTTFLAGLSTATGQGLSLAGGTTDTAYSGTVFSPFQASPTQHFLNSGSQSGIADITGRHSLSTSYDGFSIYTASGNITGTIRVYGYNNG